MNTGIKKTCLYNFDPLKLYFYIVKIGVYRSIHYFYFCSKHRLWVLIRTASSQSMFWAEIKKYISGYLFLSENFHFLVVKFSVYLNSHVFVMELSTMYKLGENLSIVLALLKGKNNVGKVCRWDVRSWQTMHCDANNIKIGRTNK